jgi:hypothetical protein
VLVPISGFWSYVREDDHADKGRIVNLRNDLVAEFGMLTGESLDLFTDQVSLRWGDSWKDKIDSILASGTFFVPIITPRYFQSAACRGELQAFARRAKDLGATELILPVLYVHSPEFDDTKPADELIELVNSFQREDWTGLRFEERDSAGYRRGVGKLAERLRLANAEAESGRIGGVVEVVPISANESEPPGWLDQLVAMETSFPVLTKTLESINQEIVALGEIAESRNEEMEKAKSRPQGSLAAQLVVTGKLAQDFEAPTDRIFSLAQEYTSQLHDVDSGLRTLIELAPTMYEVADDEGKETICTFLENIAASTEAAKNGLGSTEELVHTLTPLESTSRVLRPVLRRLRAGLTVLVEGRDITDAWARLVADSGIPCNEGVSGNVVQPHT